MHSKIKIKENVVSNQLSLVLDGLRQRLIYVVWALEPLNVFGVVVAPTIHIRSTMVHGTRVFLAAKKEPETN